jgi:tRNA modification GTPase
VRLLDGAGLGVPRDDLDSEGMRLARQAIEESDLVLVILDTSRPVEAADEQILALTSGRPRLVIANKSDLAPALPALGKQLSIDCACSALTGAGVGALQALLGNWVTGRTGADGEEGGIVASLRVLEHLVVAHQRVDDAVRQLEKVPLEAVLIDLKNAMTRLDRVLGIEADDAVLHRIFATFCLGK